MTEKEYFKLLDRLVKGAEKLSNPLLTDAKKKQYRRLYDEIERHILEYKGLL
ncbi:hypothetical protein ACFO25_10035 [Paenactinomyces guangxiensis]|uniref:Uncharacterized protein n=1 Tax=Paenactinomyces guangxiensis TaxID=1490290 RepID=A0A7W2A9D3_9BACL|nr:hypothetical protein [Paenactinomyces guangxiensis]MBA4495124.1 hypothetical protein [Paenactinomyces guangxiensis]MBH8592192.1 hypothetical protein [Paenactinomyces guangxiensis]